MYLFIVWKRQGGQFGAIKRGLISLSRKNVCQEVRRTKQEPKRYARFFFASQCMRK